MHHDGDLTITKDNAHLYTDLVLVGGHLYIHADTTLPVLTSVGGVLYIYAPTALPALTSVGGHLYICARVTLPVLTSVGGDLYIRTPTTLPVLTSAHGVTGCLLCVSEWGLWLSDEGLFYAGCQAALTKDQALAHWDRTDERAVMFTAAILAT